MMLTAAELALQFDPDTRALWHLELLGCYAPDDAIAPYLPPPARPLYDEDNDNDCDDWGDLACTHCGGEGFCEVDDPMWDECDEYGWGPCGACHGTGSRKHQWVF